MTCQQAGTDVLTVSEIAAAARGWTKRAPGAPCPVPRGTMIQIRSAFETDFDDEQMPRRAGAWDWSGAGDLCDITHFRVVQ